ncbi:uncharacterized protein LY89DRAFT_292791 [Mollisia scopiformis]|uniref:Uncharacterized protein n=1 Tax=Mollisia scopiformis TaxID=149040 RepID=A0A194XPV6_MOLSC|nr:uncharacterized protein LY89DRAFT_292791 [Mollisia scopiformis]KUJ22290.1 hypothetical protein LY89DRAFT_292791 [Mollisia scopiformis]
MEEVKILYSKGQYKHCAVRCKQILDNVKDPHQVHPLYSIYLSFFAASSLEMTASTLHNHSSNKLPLFQESLFFYKKAQFTVDNVSFHTPATSHHSNASITSSVRSSVDSIFSSPTNSARSSVVSSPTDDNSLPTHKRTISASSSFSSLSSNRKKKVSFSIDISTSMSSDESEQEAPPAIESSLLDSFPAPPTQPDPTITSTKDLQLQEPQSLSIYLLTQSIARYKSHLRDLSIQLEYHISSIHSQIGHLSLVRKARRSNLPTQFSDAEERSFGAMSGVSREEMLKVELRERIRRLKETGWKRERFDGERYRVLCEKALMEARER